jgi:hypothetical protein
MVSNLGQDNLPSGEFTYLLAHHFTYYSCGVASSLPFQSSTSDFLAFRYPDS